MIVNETTFEFSPATDTTGAQEQELVGELRAGSVEAFNYLIALYHQPIYHLVFRMLGDAADSADAVQEIFLKVFRAARSFEGKSSLKTWIYRIAVHEASNYRRWWQRHKRRESSLEAEDSLGRTLADRLSDPTESPLQLAMRAEGQRQLARALRAVAEPYRTVMLLREMEGFGYQEIAEILGVHVGTVKSRLIRGREMLRRRLLGDRELCRELGVPSIGARTERKRSEAPPVRNFNPTDA